MMGPVSSTLRDHVQLLLDERRVVVWYDPYQSFGSFVEGVTFERAETFILDDDGYFALRKKTDPLASKLREGAQNGASILVYVPRQPLKQQSDLLFPLASLGTTFDDTLHQVARRALKDRFSTQQIREWTDVEGVTLAKLDELAGEASSISPLDVVFGNISPEQVGLEFLRSADRADKTDEAGLVANLQSHLETTFGVRFPGEDLDAAELREAFAQRVLLYEFLDDLVEIPEALSHLELPSDRQVAASRRLAENLRDLAPLEADYRSWAFGAEETFQLTAVDYDPEKIGRCDTFAFEERYALRQAQEYAKAGDWDRAESWVEERGSSFWATRDEERKGQWLTSRRAVRLRKEADRVMTTVPEGASPVRWVEWYVAAAGAWQVDRMARKLDESPVSFADLPDLGDVIRLAREQAHALEQRAAEGFVQAVHGDPDALGGLSQQTAVFKDYVRGAVESGKTAVFVLADALRFEMGQDLGSVLEEGGEVRVDHAIAALPTITKIGMAGLTPGAEGGLSLKMPGKKVVAEVGNTPLPDVNARKKRFEAEFGARFLDLTLDACITKSPNWLKKKLDDADFVLLRSQEIDSLGEMDNLLQARKFMSSVIDDLKQAIQRLVGAGVEEVVVAADHGYLLRADVSDAMKLECPPGAVETHRRCVMGPELEGGDHHVVFKASALGMGGDDLQIAFPNGINVFKVPGGNRTYLHGGLSLQETVIPVVRYTPAARGEAAKGPATMEVTVPGDKVTNAFFQVVVAYQAGDLFEQGETRRFRVAAWLDDEAVTTVQTATVGYLETGEVELGNGDESVVMLGLTERLEGTGTLEIRVIDTKIGETIAKKKVPYELAF